MSRGFFGIGVEGISKQMNLGSLMRTGHAFGASFLFTVNPSYSRREARYADTSASDGSVPLYKFDKVTDLMLPEKCTLVGIELIDDAIDLPSFHHPKSCAYILGPERGSLSPEMLARCDMTIKIPTKFCINVALAGALVMYDRTIQMGRFPARPVTPGGPIEQVKDHVHGAPKWVKKDRRRAEKLTAN